MTEILNMEIKGFLFIFLRFGSAIMFMPAFMSSYINVKFRLSIALSITLILVPILGTQFTTIDLSGFEYIRVILCEITIGVFLGLIMQVFFASLNLAGNIAGQALGFANAQIFEPSFQTQSIVIQSFLSITALAVIFATNTHHLMISAIIDSYNVFPVGNSLPTGDLSKSISQNLNESFSMGFQIGAPFVAFTVVFYVGMGLISKLMPQLNIFFLSQPLQIYLGLGLLLITTPIMIMWFLKYYDSALQQFLR